MRACCASGENDYWKRDLGVKQLSQDEIDYYKIKQRQKLIHKLKNLKCPFHLKIILQRKDDLIETCKFLQQQEYKTN